ncbi:caspase-6-like [Oscarella lobularis]|uniref:caspase-6-like n=1 Tax=Oscarella lobularis TaxID=121494 RepID=UPI0033133AC5
MASKAVYIFTLDDRERQRSFDFSGTISHADLFEKNTAAIQGLLPALKRGVRTTVDITAKDTGDSFLIEEDVKAETYLVNLKIISDHDTPDDDVIEWEKVEEKKPKRVSARGGGVQMSFGGAVAKGDGASAINEAVADYNISGTQSFSTSEEGARADGKGAKARLTRKTKVISVRGKTTSQSSDQPTVKKVKEEPPIEVTSNDFREGEYDYKRNVGKVLIVNNYKFIKSSKTRLGSKEDGDRLVDLFQEPLKFEKSAIQQIFNKTEKEIIEAVESFVDEDFEDFSCSVFILMSHGNKSTFVDYNGKQFEINKILNLFRKSEKLRGKPKLFFFQACRGKGNAASVAPDSYPSKETPPPVESDMADFRSMPNSADFFIGYCSSFGDQSFRYTEDEEHDYGSWYMLSLVESIRKHYKKLDVAEIHYLVNRLVSENHGCIKGGSVEVKQAPQFVCSLRGKFYLSNCVPTAQEKPSS